MPSRYKSASNELLHWLLLTSGVPPTPTHPATITSIVDLARLISAQHPRTPLPAPIRSRFESVIRLRSAANRFWARVEARNPCAEVRAKNEAHRAFIAALEVAFEMLTEGGAGEMVKEEEEVGGNVFACLTVYATVEGEVEQLDEGAKEQRTIVTPGRKRKKKKTRAKTKGGKSTALPQPTADARSAVLGFMRELETLRKFIADTWREVASGQLNTAVAGALSLTATRIVEDLQARVSADFPKQWGSFQDMVDLINGPGASSDSRKLSCMDSHRSLVRFIDACQQRSRDLLESPLESDDVSAQYCLLAMAEEFGCPGETGALGPTKLVHEIIGLVLVRGAAHFTTRLRPATVFQFQIVLDSIAAAQERRCEPGDPPHLADLRRFQARFGETEAVLRVRLRERHIQGDLDVLQILKTAVGGLGRTRVWKLCPWVCGVGLALAVDAVSNYATQLWTQSGVPLMMFHFYNLLRRQNVLRESSFLESLWKLTGGRVLIPHRQRAVSAPEGARGMVEFIQYASKPSRGDRDSRRGVGSSPVWETKLDSLNRASPFISLAAEGWYPRGVRGEDWAPQGKHDSTSVLARIKQDLVLDVTGPLPVAGLDLLLILLAFDLFFKEVFWAEIAEEWGRHGLDEPVFGDFHDVVLRWVMSTCDDESLDGLLKSIGECMGRSLESMDVPVFRYFKEVAAV